MSNLIFVDITEAFEVGKLQGSKDLLNELERLNITDISFLKKYIAVKKEANAKTLELLQNLKNRN